MLFFGFVACSLSIANEGCTSRAAVFGVRPKRPPKQFLLPQPSDAIENFVSLKTRKVIALG
jgi:hypothetical protein